MKAKPNKAPEKKWFDVKMEALVPMVLTYRVLAEDEHSAIELALKKMPNQAKPNLALKRLLKAVVYMSGTFMVKLTKSFR